MKLNFIITLLLVLAVSSAAYAVPVSNSGNPHNMSSGSAAGSIKAKLPSEGGTDQVCIFCHVPHSASPKSALWSRPDPDGPLGTGIFPVYAAALIAGNPGLTGYDATSPDYPSGASRMCLSCHDGTTSIGILLDNQIIVMDVGSEQIANHDGLKMVVDLATSHPISFNYNQSVVSYIDPLEVDYQVPTATFTPLDGNGQMQCTTCHDPHEDTRASAVHDNLPFWRHSSTTPGDAYADVCNSCHKTPPLASTHSLP